MSGGNETLMRTRCPECGTVFRVTSEQLRRKAGKVRCGHCQAVFNAFDHWQSDTDETLIAAPVEEPARHLGGIEPAEPAAAVVLEPWTEAKPEPEATEPEAFDPAATIVEGSDWAWNESMEPLVVASEPEAVLTPEVVSQVPEQDEAPPSTDTVAVLAPETDIPEMVRFDAAETLVATPADRIGLADDRDETFEQSTSAAREAGLVAARELAETNSYNRWSAGTLASDGRGAFGSEPVARAIWPFVVVSVLLLIALLGQLAYHYRTDIVMRLPALQPLYASLGVDIPLPRNPALVSIETSDLQSDNARGLFVLQATLKNRAPFPQAWPALELSLTDTNDAVVSRRVMYAAEYLPPGTTSDAFPANGDVAVRLWIEAKDIGASGYRLYIFYP